MSKELYNELQAAFEELKKTEAKKIYDAIENKEFIPVPFTLPVVINTLKDVLEKHTITKDEFFFATSLLTDSLSPEELKTLNEVYDSLVNEENMEVHND